MGARKGRKQGEGILFAKIGKQFGVGQERKRPPTSRDAILEPEEKRKKATGLQHIGGAFKGALESRRREEKKKKGRGRNSREGQVGGNKKKKKGNNHFGFVADERKKKDRFRY